MSRSSATTTLRGRRALAVPAGVLLLCLGCSGRSVNISPVDDLGWPPGDPRVRLQAVVDLGPSHAGPKQLRDPRYGTSFRRPYAVAWDGRDLLVVDPDTARVARIDSSGDLTLSGSGLFRQPADVASCASGILVSDAAAGRIAILEPDLSFRGWLAEELVRPTGITCDGERIFVAETGGHRILQFVDGRPGPSLGSRGTEPGQFNFPTSVTVHDGSLLVGDALNFRLQQIDPDSGRATAVFGRLGDSPGDMARLKGIAVDRRGNVWVADAHLDRVSLYRLDGELLLSLGGTGARMDEFSFPAGIAASPDGRVAVIDSLNLRVKIFRVLDRPQEQDA